MLYLKLGLSVDNLIPIPEIIHLLKIKIDVLFSFKHCNINRYIVIVIIIQWL